MEKDSSQMRILRKSERKEQLFLLLSLLFCLFTLAAIYPAPYNGDDAINCLTGGYLAYSGRSLWDHTKMLLDSWMSTGRFYPMAFYSYAVFTWLPTLFLYRSFQIILNFFVILSFAVLVRKISGRFLYAGLAVLLLPVFFQYRYYQDPILAYHGMLQFVALYLIWATFFFLIAVETRRWRYSVISALFFAFALMTYEISYAFLALFIIIPFIRGTEKKRWLMIIPHGIVSVFLLLYTLFLRSQAVSSYAGISFSFDPYGLAKAFLSQLSAAIPLSYWILATPTFLPYSKTAFLDAFRIEDAIGAALLLALLLMVVYCFPLKKPGGRIWIYGLAFWILPATILSLSSRYQTELSPGVGYLPVYVEYFGGVLLAIAIVSFLLGRVSNRKVQRVLAVCIALCFSCGFLINSVNNRCIVQFYSENNTQLLSTQALSSGLFSSLKQGDRLLIMNGGYGMNFEPCGFVYQYADSLAISPVTVRQLAEDNGTIPDDETAVLYPRDLSIYYAAGDPDLGMAQIAQVESLTYRTEDFSIVSASVTDITVYLSGASQCTLSAQTPQGLVAISAEDIYSNPTLSSQILTLQPENATVKVIERMTPIGVQRSWEKYFAPFQGDSCIVHIAPNDGETIEFPITGVP